MIKIFSILGCVLGLLFSCRSADTSERGDQQADSVIAQTISVGNDTLNSILIHYLDVKEALVASNADQTAAAAGALAEALEKIEGCQTTAQLAQQMKANAELEQQRQHFSIISQDLIAMFQHADVTSGTLYVAHCPMYNDNQGGEWLSETEEISNPYFGEAMLRCGKVVQEMD